MAEVVSTGSGVSDQVRKVRRQMLRDESVKRWMDTITTRLDAISGR